MDKTIKDLLDISQHKLDWLDFGTDYEDSYINNFNEWYATAIKDIAKFAWLEDIYWIKEINSQEEK